MTKKEKSKTNMPKTEQDYINEVYALVGKIFPCTIRIDGMGKMIYFSYETEYDEGNLTSGYTKKMLTAIEQSSIDTWRDSYLV